MLPNSIFSIYCRECKIVDIEIAFRLWMNKFQVGRNKQAVRIIVAAAKKNEKYKEIHKFHTTIFKALCILNVQTHSIILIYHYSEIKHILFKNLIFFKRDIEYF